MALRRRSRRIVPLMSFAAKGVKQDEQWEDWSKKPGRRDFQPWSSRGEL